MAAGLGAACGVGLYALVAIALVAALIVLLFGGPLERGFAKRVSGEPQDPSGNNGSGP